MSSPSFDPFTQNITFHDENGSPFDVPLTFLDSFCQFNLRMSINYAAQLGASIVFLVILFIMTRPEKRRCVIFWLNISALVFNVGRLFCQVLYYTGPWSEMYANLANDYSRVPSSAYANSIITVIISTILLICIEFSLVFQVHVLCTTLRRRYRLPLLVVSYLLVLVVIAFRIWLAVGNLINIMGSTYSWSLIPLQKVNTILITSTICFFSAVFVLKLGYAIRIRKKLGITDLGPMKVLFIMGFQTMLIPVIFVTVQYGVNDIPEISANSLTIIAISLPLSSLWAKHRLDSKLGKKSTLIPSTSGGSSYTFETTCFAARGAARPSDLEIGRGIAVARDVTVLSYKHNNGSGSTARNSGMAAREFI
ncbi:hypothetical protein MPDQ_003501 [Monascus purpureus]|uniref:Pheromone alpha factor receptor n=1 Tax=Monascus purpureus TaxID=5098 RepID=A0A507QZI8_MONPU|nr:hypothetical protein MPDQ_003501 [Monascus purpureus]BDD57157.1 hypothetical protein MAP00_002547 [Monascus purpureus]